MKTTATQRPPICTQDCPPSAAKNQSGTIYRNLDLLARLGMIQKMEMAGAETCFDGDVRRQRHHIRCVRWEIADLAGPPLDLMADSHHDFGGYEIIGHRLEFVGVCPRVADVAKTRLLTTNTTQGDSNMLKPKIQDALNGQLNAELASSYLYLSMAAHFEEKNFRGMGAMGAPGRGGMGPRH